MNTTSSETPNDDPGNNNDPPPDDPPAESTAEYKYAKKENFLKSIYSTSKLIKIDYDILNEKYQTTKKISIISRDIIYPSELVSLWDEISGYNFVLLIVVCAIAIGIIYKRKASIRVLN